MQKKVVSAKDVKDIVEEALKDEFSSWLSNDCRKLRGEIERTFHFTIHKMLGFDHSFGEFRISRARNSMLYESLKKRAEMEATSILENASFDLSEKEQQKLKKVIKEGYFEELLEAVYTAARKKAEDDAEKFVEAMQPKIGDITPPH